MPLIRLHGTGLAHVLVYTYTQYTHDMWQPQATQAVTHPLLPRLDVGCEQAAVREPVQEGVPALALHDTPLPRAVQQMLQGRAEGQISQPRGTLSSVQMASEGAPGTINTCSLTCCRGSAEVSQGEPSAAVQGPGVYHC